MSKHWAWFPSEVHTNTGRLCAAGSGRDPVPRRHRSSAALRLPAPFSHRSGSPCVWPTSLRALVLCLRGRRHVRPARVVRRRRVTGSPPHRSVSRRGEGLPGYGAVLFVRAMVAHPAGYGPLLAHPTEKPLLPSGKSGPWASGKARGFGAACPMAHPFACLRLADGLSATGARLATGRAGSPLAGQDAHLLDDTQGFMKALHPPVPIDPHCLVALIFLSPQGVGGRGQVGLREKWLYFS